MTPATEIHVALERLEWLDVEEAHDEALRIDDFLALVESLRPHILADESVAREIEEADRAKGVDWTVPVDLAAFRRYCDNRRRMEGAAGFEMKEE